MLLGGGGSPSEAGTDGTEESKKGSTGQAGATWLEETDEVWVLETAASSSPNGFFPQHTVVIMQFLNWRSQKQITIRVMTPSRVVKLILHREATYSSIWFLVSQIRKTIAYKKTPANCLSVNNLNLNVTTNLIIEVSKGKKSAICATTQATIHLSLYMTELLK